ncbi:uncharacterized protein LOC131680435 isoform X1 [Topomyia yanbarensis]|uniref:uncharacterized protein LOC131680435 isoform X1 n=1 Tax=Topomyia yanbarensis TaxID=2498891 RepID=UPI00273A9731|nr:uncharacterized protein LOC131680435 isoform X1 [Topomyia yanbarensis]
MVQRMQKELLNDSMFIERLESDDENDPTVAAQQNDFSCETIQLEKVTNIDEIFSTTQTGNEVMEILRTNTSPNEQCLKTIKTVLCDFLRSNYGLRPPTFYKNLLAQLLVKRYPVLASATCDVPQALWFHPNARGKNRHSGRLHYHMEYLARKSGERVIPRNKLQRVSQLDTLPDVSPIIPANDMDQLIIEQKFLCPGPNTKARAIELWQLTFADRDIFRKRAEMGTYLKDNPMSTAFNGLLITLDFEALVHNTNNFMDQFEDLKPMVLARYHELYQNITDDTARVLAIIRKYNPSRGAKRAKDADPVKENALKDIIEWLQILVGSVVVVAHRTQLRVVKEGVEIARPNVVISASTQHPIMAPVQEDSEPEFRGFPEIETRRGTKRKTEAVNSPLRQLRRSKRMRTKKVDNVFVYGKKLS